MRRSRSGPLRGPSQLLRQLRKPTDHGWGAITKLRNIARRIRLRIGPLRLLVLVVVCWVAVAAWQIRQASGEVAAAVHRTSVVEAELADFNLSGKVEVELSAAIEQFSRAENRLAGAILLPLRYLPFAGRQLGAMQALSSAARQISQEGLVGLRAARLALGSDLSASNRSAVLRRLEEVAGSVEQGIGNVDLGPDRGLLSPIAGRRARMAAQIESAEESLGRARRVLGVFAGLMEGSHRYLLLVGNNAEMRSGSGMFLSAGLLKFDGGVMTMDEIMRTPDLEIPDDRVPLDPQFAALWGWLHPNREWRNLALTPRFDVTGGMASRMWEASGGEPVSGVVAVGVDALRAILLVTGPVQLSEGREINAGYVRKYLLHDQYRSIEYGRGEFDPSQQARRDQLGELAGAAVDSLNRPEFDYLRLGKQLRKAARGRHILLWSREAPVQSAWSDEGLTGEVGGSDLMATIINRGANKLDYFLDAEAELEIRPIGPNNAITVRVKLTNNTPPGEPRYIQGPVFDDPTSAAGLYKAIASFTLPGNATKPWLTGVQALVAKGPDGSSEVIAGSFELPPGETTELVVRFILPATTRRIRVLPSGRLPEVRWEAGGANFVESKVHTLEW